MTMRRLAQQLKPFLEAAERVPFVDLLLAAAFGRPTWLLAAGGGLAMVYLAAGGRTDWSTTELLLAALAAGAVVAAATTALTFIWMLIGEILRQHRTASDIAPPQASRPSETSAQAQAVAPPAAPLISPAPPPPPPPKRVYRASELRSRLRALVEVAEQLDGPIQDAFDLGHTMAMHIGDACRDNTKQEVIDRFNLFKSFAEAAQKDLAATLKKHPFPEIAEIGPWDCGPVVDKTGVLTLLIPVVPEHVLREHNFSTPALRQAGADWIDAVNGFGLWLDDRKRKLVAQYVECETAQLQG